MVQGFKGEIFELIVYFMLYLKFDRIVQFNIIIKLVYCIEDILP